MKLRLWNIFILGLLLTSNMIPAFAEDSDTRELETFFDNFMAEKLPDLNIPGASLIVVQDGEIVLSKGYGFADIDSETPVNPAETIFRVGSVSKLFTATAVMQLVERGEVDLHTDITQYLTAFQIPATYAEPVTLHHLLTHSSGFEDRFIGGMTLDENKLGSIEDFLQDALPARVTPPGEVHSYNNYGFALAGYVVEEVSGMPFEDYVYLNILQPLGMTLSSFAQPLPLELKAQLATGYELAGDDLAPAVFQYDRAVPAGSMSSTAEDMAAFMIAHLQSGGSEILDESIADLMHQQQFTPTTQNFQA